MAGIFKWKHIERPMILVKIEEIAVARNGINVIIYPPYCKEIPGIFVNFFVPDSIGAPLMVGGKEELSIISMNGIRILVGSGIGFVYFFSIFPDVIFLIGRNPDDIGIVSFYIQGVFCIIARHGSSGKNGRSVFIDRTYTINVDGLPDVFSGEDDTGGIIGNRVEGRNFFNYFPVSHEGEFLGNRLDTGVVRDRIEGAVLDIRGFDDGPFWERKLFFPVEPYGKDRVFRFIRRVLEQYKSRLIVYVKGSGADRNLVIDGIDQLGIVIYHYVVFRLFYPGLQAGFLVNGYGGV